MQRAFRTRVLLCHVDVDDVVEPLAQVTKAALLNECTLICAWSPEVLPNSNHSNAFLTLLKPFCAGQYLFMSTDITGLE